MYSTRSSTKNHSILAPFAAALVAAGAGCSSRSGSPADASAPGLIPCDAADGGSAGAGDAGPLTEVAATLLDFVTAAESVESALPTCGTSVGATNACSQSGSFSTSGAWTDCPTGGSGTSSYSYTIGFNNCDNTIQQAALQLNGSVVLSGTVTQMNGAITSWTARLTGTLAFNVTLPGYAPYAADCPVSLDLAPTSSASLGAGAQVSGTVCGLPVTACFQAGSLPVVPDAGVGPADAGPDAGVDAGPQSGGDAGPIDGGSCTCDTLTGCSGTADAGFFSTCPAGTICDPGAEECVSSRYTANGDGTVTDNVTGLLWQQDVPANPCPNDGTGACTLADAESYCAGLNLGGSSGWTVPTLPQLFSLVDIGRFPTIDSSAFPGTPTNIAFWSSWADGTGYAWDVSFSNGNNIGYSTNGFTDEVRCVQ